MCPVLCISGFEPPPPTPPPDQIGPFKRDICSRYARCQNELLPIVINLKFPGWIFTISPSLGLAFASAWFNLQIFVLNFCTSLKFATTLGTLHTFPMRIVKTVSTLGRTSFAYISPASCSAALYIDFEEEKKKRVPKHWVRANEGKRRSAKKARYLVNRSRTLRGRNHPYQSTERAWMRVDKWKGSPLEF